MKNYNFRSRSLFSGPHLLGMLFIAAGLLAIVSPAIIKSDSSVEKSFYVGVVFIGLGSVIVSTYSGTVIEFNNKKVKDYLSVLGYQFVTWKNLPDIKRIAVIPVNYKTANTPNGVSPTWSGTVLRYKVFLYSENAKPVLSFIFSNRERAIKTGEHLSANLDAVCELSEPQQV